MCEALGQEPSPIEQLREAVITHEHLRLRPLRPIEQREAGRIARRRRAEQDALGVEQAALAETRDRALFVDRHAQAIGPLAADRGRLDPRIATQAALHLCHRHREETAAHLARHQGLQIRGLELAELPFDEHLADGQGLRIGEPCPGKAKEHAEVRHHEGRDQPEPPRPALRPWFGADQSIAQGTVARTCGVKVWIFKGEVMAHDPMAQDKRAAEQAPQR